MYRPLIRPLGVGEMYALLPLLIAVMVMGTIMKVVSGVTKPEVLKEVVPAAAEALVLKRRK